MSSWVRAGVVLAMLAFCGSARAQFDFLRNRDPDSSNEPKTPADAARQRAGAAYHAGNYKEAIEITDLLANTDPNDHVAFYLRGSAKIEAGRAAQSKDQIRDGIADARQGLALAGRQYPWLYVPYFYGLTSLAELEKRAEHADLVVSISGPLIDRPDVPVADRAQILYQRALAYGVKADWKAQIADLSEAIRLSPEHLGAYIKRCDAFAALGNQAQTLAAYDQAVDAFPNNVLVVNNRGSYRRTRGMLDGAIVDFTRALQIDPRFAVGYINRGIALTESNQPQAAESDFTQALALDPKLQWVYGLRGAARLARGQASGATSDFTRAIKSNPLVAGGYADRGFSFFAEKNFVGAAADFERALKMDPRRSELVAWRFVALSRAGQGDAAKASLEPGLDAAKATVWTGRVCGYLAGRVTEEQLIESAKGANAQEQNQRLCEARFFIGEKKLIGGEAEEARAAFLESAQTKAFALAAYRCARYESGEFKRP